MTQLFQVNLRGIIELLSNHLYSGPQVFVRELLQNGVDALTARAELEPGFGREQGAVRVSLRDDAGVPMVMFEDDGIGLTESEIHQFLATLGESSKRRVNEGGAPVTTDLIGQFGIGLLACFLVSDEIVVRTRSARDAHSPSVEWRGRQDGTYSVRPLTEPLPHPGTRVELRARADRLEWFTAERIVALLEHFGALLPWTITFCSIEGKVRINDEPPPWRIQHDDVKALGRSVLEYGQRLFDTDFLDYIPLEAESGAVQGVAFVLPFAASLAEPRTHRVYLKGMLVSERSTQVMPPWAFFVQCVVDAHELRPTASREALYEDEALADTREQLGRSLRSWLLWVAKHDPRRLTALISVHHRAIKALAAEDDDVLAMFADVLPFETTSGMLSFAEIRAQSSSVEYARSVDTFRQIAPVASAQGKLLVNAGFAFDEEVLVRACTRAKLGHQRVDSSTLTEELDDLGPRDQERTRSFVALAERVVQRFGCDVTLKAFRPEELPAFYAASRDVDLRRQIERTQDKAKGIWSSVLGSIGKNLASDERPLLCLNFKNPVVRRLASVEDDDAVELALSLLYVHALLLSHQPLRAAEQQLLPTAIMGFIEWGLATHGGRTLQ
jgi:molecular chaperone HtpG